MWAQELHRGLNGPLCKSSCGYCSRPVALSSREAAKVLPAIGSLRKSWSKGLLSSVLAASLISGTWASGPRPAGALVTFQGSRLSSAELSCEHQQLHPLDARFTARAIIAAATNMSAPSRLEGYLMAKGHNAQINRLYYSIPVDQVASQNAVFFVGDFVDGDGDALIERLNTGEGVAATLTPKLAPRSNLFIVYPSSYTDGRWSSYTSMLPSTSATGEPLGFDGKLPKAAKQLAALLDDALRQLATSEGGCERTDGGTAAEDAGKRQAAAPAGSEETVAEATAKPGESGSRLPTFVMGFSKGGVVLNELLAEMAALEDRRGACLSKWADGVGEQAGDETRLEECARGVGAAPQEGVSDAEVFLESISEVHYIDVGLICPGAYLTDPQKLSSVVRRGNRQALTIGLHGTPRQWAEKRRPWIGLEKDRMLAALQNEAAAHPGTFQVFQKHYLEGQKVGMRMHFEIVDLAKFARS